MLSFVWTDVSGDVHVIVTSREESVLMHDRLGRFTQRKLLPLLPDTFFIFSDDVYKVTDNCNISPLAVYNFNYAASVKVASDWLVVKRKFSCDVGDNICAEFNDFQRFGHLEGPDFQQVFIDHVSEIYRPRFA